MEVWKATKVEDYPTKMYENKTEEKSENDRTLRPSSVKELKDYAKTKIGEESFYISAGQLWKQAPREIKEAKNLNLAKKLTKKYSLTMPI